MHEKTWIRVAGLVGFLGVALGAFGAHALKPTLESTGGADWWQTATLYHLVHAAVMTSSLARGTRFPAALFFGIGILFFSGSLYVMALTGMTRLGMITPIGGLFFLVGWLRLAMSSTTHQPK